ncbi:3'-5' exonuclease [Halarcobacter ebronensis]|uniref:3'-5' exonuclease n=1 Tax=Halarcobacter ebronensis TaxID=1462615 RepID=UPI003C70DF47
MKSNKNFYSSLVDKLKKSPILFDDFLDILSRHKEKFFDNPELEFELLLSNGFPIDIEDDKVFLKTTKTKISEQTFCIVDIETNGGHVNKGHQIIEIGAVKYRNGEILDSFESLVYAKDIPEYIQGVTNITPSMLEDAPLLKKVLEKFKIFLEDDVFVAHDIKFDYNFISNSLEKCNLGRLCNRKLCTIDLARRTIKAEKYGLKSLKEVLQIDIDNHHRAYSDALSTTYILKEAIKHLDKSVVTVEDLITYSKNAKPVMPKMKVNHGKKEEKQKVER